MFDQARLAHRFDQSRIVRHVTPSFATVGADRDGALLAVIGLIAFGATVVSGVDHQAAIVKLDDLAFVGEVADVTA